ncbi:YiiX/YebB-like N1pC/P60 family cysteine hydrolase [Rubritalea tangerina]|uniref:YiiX/YebB-like N1pC/P60 family cysteine hydrolase n=2 Tax=Rubritalea tangerina TaxID=430798 RepID=A0ABW4ZBL9_9BACT
MSLQPNKIDPVLELVVSATKGIPHRSELVELLDDVNAAQDRGYFLPDEDERLRDSYRQYLRLRAVLLGCIADLEPHYYDEDDWENCLRSFAVAFTAACVLMRAAEYIVDLAGDHFLVWKKLDEAEQRYGIERGSYTRLYKSLTSPRRMWRFYEATLFWELHADEIMGLREEGGRMQELIEVLEEELPFIRRSKTGYLKRQLQYRVFSFKRRHHSGYRKVMFQLFRMSGRVIAEVKQPVLAIQKSGKRVTPRVLAKAWSILQPGDVIITRHDEAMSNLFLPGFWPHAAFYIGSQEQREALGIEEVTAEGVNVVEAKKDGVHFRALTETLAVDAFTILRPTLEKERVAEAVRCAMSHAGKRYDFVFDFRQSDRLACTEVVYRSYQSGAGVDFELEEKAGRLCLSAEGLMNQAIRMGVFEPVAIYGVDGIKVHTGEQAQLRLARSYAANWG